VVVDKAALVVADSATVMVLEERHMKHRIGQELTPLFRNRHRSGPVPE
jgi:hypothetical protein